MKLKKVLLVKSICINKDKKCLGSVMAAYRSPKPLVGVQIPAGTPNKKGEYENFTLK